MATKMLKENPSLKASSISRPIVTNALTHGLSLVADLFVNDEDTILLPTHNWGNYKLILIQDIRQILKLMLFSSRWTLYNKLTCIYFR